MKMSRKILVMVMALVMLLAMASMVSAATGSITVGNQQDGRTYDVYQVAAWVDDGNGNQWYKVNDAWKTIVGEYYELDSSNYITGMKSGATDATFVAGVQTWLQTEANRTAVAATKAADLSAAEYGYYVLVSVDADGTVGANIGAATLNADNPSITLREKNMPDGELPTVGKTVTDPEGTTYVTGDTVNFKIEVECEEDAAAYTVHDRMQGMTLNEGSINVTYSGTATVTRELVKPGTACGGCTFEIKLAFTGDVYAYDKVTITYSATVTDDFVNGLSNVAWIDGIEAPVGPEVELQTVSFKKVDAETGAALNGAEFELYTKEGETYVNVPVVAVENNGAVEYYRPAADGETVTAIAAGSATVKGLPKLADGESYYVKETKAPAGYVALNDYIAITTADQTIGNTQIDPLPETGGMGTTVFYVVGGMLVLAAVVLLVTKKRAAAK